MYLTLSRMIIIGILGPAAIMLHTYAWNIPAGYSLVMMFCFLGIYGAWALSICRRIEDSIIQEVFTYLQRKNP